MCLDSYPLYDVFMASIMGSFSSKSSIIEVSHGAPVLYIHEARWTSARKKEESSFQDE